MPSLLPVLSTTTQHLRRVVTNAVHRARSLPSFHQALPTDQVFCRGEPARLLKTAGCFLGMNSRGGLAVWSNKSDLFIPLPAITIHNRLAATFFGLSIKCSSLARAESILTACPFSLAKSPSGTSLSCHHYLRHVPTHWHCASLSHSASTSCHTCNNVTYWYHHTNYILPEYIGDFSVHIDGMKVAIRARMMLKINVITI